MKKGTFLLIIIIVILASALTLRIIDEFSAEETDFQYSQTAPQLEENQQEPVIGGDKDEHGCLVAAGYSWCEHKEKCLRIWEEGCEITVFSPSADQIINSPLIVRGEAWGNWFFEAVIPVKLVDKDNNLIVSHYGQAQEDWMSEEFVEFEAIVDFQTEAQEGYLVIEKNNPSGIADLDKAFRVPIKFQ